MAKKKIPINTRITSAIREIHRNYDELSKEVLREARIAPATFLCACCGCWVYSGKKTPDKLNLDVPEGIELKFEKHKIDHIDPINGVAGFQNWEEYVQRTFCEKDNYQILADSCHQKKTKIETKLRAKYRKYVKEGKNIQEVVDEWKNHVDSYLKK